MPVEASNQLLDKLESTRDLPTVPAVLIPLLEYMGKPSDQVEVHQVVKLIGEDKSLAARCLRLANSPLFGSSHEIETIQAAVVALGLDRIQQIAASCSLLKLMPDVSLGVNPSIFWAHSMACALVAQEIAKKIGYSDHAKAYAAGLLHDIGIVAILWLSPREFRRSYEYARAGGLPLHQAEKQVLGISHCESGKIIASSWHLPAEIVDVIASHHSPSQSRGDHLLPSIIAISDMLCRFGGVGYGYAEEKQTQFADEPAFAVLAAKYPALKPFQLSRLAFETEDLLQSVHEVVMHIYGSY
jgi:putative nucleotidyltransferase with HDIG domain